MNFFDSILTYISFWFPQGSLPDEFVSFLVGFLALSIVYGFTAGILSFVGIAKKTLVRAYLVLIGTWSLFFLLPMLPEGGVF